MIMHLEIVGEIIPSTCIAQLFTLSTLLQQQAFLPVKCQHNFEGDSIV